MEVLIVKLLVKLGMPEAGLKGHEVPEGSPPVQERLTERAGPPSRVTVMVVEPELPWSTVIPPELEIEKSNICTFTVVEWDSEPAVPVTVTE